MRSSVVIILLFVSLLAHGYLFGQIKIHKHLTSANGLVNDRINSIVQDKQGYIWIGTDDGLSRWDGINFVNFHKHNGLSSSRIQDLAIGSDSSIYVATYGGGLNLINEESIIILDSTKGLSTNWLLCVTVLPDGTILVGGKDGNISILKNGKFSQWISPDNLNRKDVYEIFQSKDGTYFIGTFQGGLYTLKNGKLKNYSSKDGLVNENVYYFLENPDGSIYLATNLGIHLFKDGKIEYMNPKWGRHNSSCSTILTEGDETIYFATDEGILIKNNNQVDLIGINNGLSFNEISCLFIDNYGTMYIGTYGNGIDIHHPDRLEIFNKDTGLPSDKVWSIYQDEDSKFFFGTHDGLVVDANSQARILSMADYNYGNVVKRIIKTKSGIVYAGTTYGINILSNGTDKKLTKENGLIDTYIMDMVETPNEKILAATRFGVVIIEKGRISNLTSKDGLIDDYILSIFVSKDSAIYFGTNGRGVSVYKNSSFKTLNNKNGLSDLTINVIAEGKDGMIYLGTDQGGLNILKDDTIFVMDIRSGLSSNSIQAIAISDDGKVYVSTNNGLNIIDFSQDVPKVRIIDAESGLPSNLCLDKALYIDTDGYVWVGTSNGLVKYNPQKDVENKMPPKIYITSLHIYNEDIVLQDFIKSPELEYNQNYLKFDFTGINLSAPKKMIYKYRLTGIDEDWVESKNNSVQYTNLGSGSYSFEVKAMNEFGYWSKPAKLDFVVNPAFWKTWWAYLVYFVLAAVGFVAIRRYELNRVKLKNNLRLKEFESKKLQEVNRIKSRFFANISHEFRTPLTIIIGSLEKLKSKMENNSDDKELAVMKRNASRLLQLINQLLELSRIESGNIKLTASESDIVKFLKRITASFSSLANQKNQKLTFNSVSVDDNQSKEEIFVFYDKKKLETVFYNLLSNAIKFSPLDEKIDVSLTKSDDYVKISFMNTGIEIPSEKISNIFDRFYQVDDTGTRNFEGTGIGLSLVKEYVQLHKGKIEVESNNNITAFTILLPLGKNHLRESEIVELKEEENNILNEAKNTILSESKKDIASLLKINPNDGEQTEDKTIILIVEDNPDLREMIKENLQDNYFVIEAENGVKGLKLAEETIPDLIISDIMMPEMDGYELSNKIKTNEKTNHIPVILLTAKAATEDKLAGLETGADDYLIKPFNSDELKIRVRNLIKIRKQLREKYQTQMLVKPADVIVPSTQKVFIDKLTSIIESNISNEGFSVEIMCAQIGMSRAQLHRKVKAITNQSSSEFIRNFRLQRGAELLKQDAGNIAEIAYQVGFSSQAYFTKTFQELYGQTPLEFKKLHNK